MKSFLVHPKWHKIAPHIHIEIYGRDGGPDKPRARIELSRDAPKRVVTMALKLEMQCVACGNQIHPFRVRVPKKNKDGRADHSGHIYFAAACLRATRPGCGNGKAASIEYDRIKYALRPEMANSADDELELLAEFVEWMKRKKRK